jgi:hypothetical protein
MSALAIVKADIEVLMKLSTKAEPYHTAGSGHSATAFFLLYRRARDVTERAKDAAVSVFRTKHRFAL